MHVNNTSLSDSTPITLALKATTKESKNYYSILDDDEFGIIDSGATDNYITPRAPTTERNSNHNPVNVTIPNGGTMISAATANIPHPTLPTPAKSGYIIPGLNKTLISVPKLCAAGCQVTFNDASCTVTHKGKIVWEGKKNVSNGLWYVPLNGGDIKYQQNIHNNSPYAGGIHQSTSMEETVKFLHQCLFSPMLDTLCKAINNGQ